MFKKTISNIGICLLTYTFLALFFLQVYQIQNTNSLNDLYFDTNLFKFITDSNYKLYNNINLLICFTLFICILISNLFEYYTIKSKYQKNNYSRLLTKFQRKRGTVRVQFDDNGKITRNTIECEFDDLMQPITSFQNKICNHLMLPNNYKWNTPKDFNTDYQKTLYKKEDYKPRYNASGIPICAYRKYYLWGAFNRINYINDVIHALFIGMTGKGKSQTFVLPMIQSNINAGESMFVHDPKRELLATTKNQLKDEGYKVIVLDFVNPEYSDGWNPLDFALSRWKKALNKANEDNYRNVDMSEAIELVWDIAKTISYEEDAKNAFWHEGAGDMIAGAIFFLLEQGEEKYVNFSSVNYLFQLGDKEINGENVLKSYLDNYRNHDDQSVLKLDTFFSAEGVTRSGLKATFKNKMSILTSTPYIQKMMATSTWNYDEIFEQKTAIFMVTHDEKSTYYPLVTIFIKQIYEAMVKWTRDNASSYDNKLKIPWNMYIDEMGLLPEIKDIEAIFGAARSRGMRMYCFFQSFAQLVQKYEVEGSKIIQDNATHTIYLGSKLKEVADEFEKMAGQEIYYDRKQKRWNERPVITSDKLQRFEKGRSLITALEWDPYIAKLPPYTSYCFANKPDFNFEIKNSNVIEWFNIIDDYNIKRNFDNSIINEKKQDIFKDLS